MSTKDPVQEHPVSNIQPDRQLKESKSVPSTPLARALGFGNLGVHLALSSLKTVSLHNFYRKVITLSLQAASNVGASEEQRAQNKKLASEADAEQIADALRTMRGAALKIGQWMSLQEESVLPPPLAKALETVKATALLSVLMNGILSIDQHCQCLVVKM
jgi:aarF domain-containing kinase